MTSLSTDPARKYMSGHWSATYRLVWVYTLPLHCLLLYNREMHSAYKLIELLATSHDNGLNWYTFICKTNSWLKGVYDLQFYLWKVWSDPNRQPTLSQLAIMNVFFFSLLWILKISMTKGLMNNLRMVHDITWTCLDWALEACTYLCILQLNVFCANLSIRIRTYNSGGNQLIGNVMMWGIN